MAWSNRCKIARLRDWTVQGLALLLVAIAAFVVNELACNRDGMNWYAYCGNSPVGRTDPTGLATGFRFGRSTEYDREQLEFSWIDENGETQRYLCDTFGDWISWASETTP